MRRSEWRHTGGIATLPNLRTPDTFFFLGAAARQSPAKLPNPPHAHRLLSRVVQAIVDGSEHLQGLSAWYQVEAVHNDLALVCELGPKLGWGVEFEPCFTLLDTCSTARRYFRRNAPIMFPGISGRVGLVLKSDGNIIPAMQCASPERPARQSEEAGYALCCLVASALHLVLSPSTHFLNHAIISKPGEGPEHQLRRHVGTPHPGGAKDVPLRECLSPGPGDRAPDEAGGRLGRAVPTDRTMSMSSCWQLLEHICAHVGQLAGKMLQSSRLSRFRQGTTAKACFDNFEAPARPRRVVEQQVSWVDSRKLELQHRFLALAPDRCPDARFNVEVSVSQLFDCIPCKAVRSLWNLGGLCSASESTCMCSHACEQKARGYDATRELPCLYWEKAKGRNSIAPHQCYETERTVSSI